MMEQVERKMGGACVALTQFSRCFLSFFFISFFFKSQKRVVCVYLVCMAVVTRVTTASTEDHFHLLFRNNPLLAAIYPFYFYFFPFSKKASS